MSFLIIKSEFPNFYLISIASNAITVYFQVEFCLLYSLPVYLARLASCAMQFSVWTNPAYLCSRPLTILAALHWTCFNRSMSFSTEGLSIITSPDLLPRFPLIQLRVLQGCTTISYTTCSSIKTLWFFWPLLKMGATFSYSSHWGPLLSLWPFKDVAARFLHSITFHINRFYILCFSLWSCHILPSGIYTHRWDPPETILLQA